MLEFKLNVPERKTLVRRIEELTGLHSRYTRTPRCAFEIGECGEYIVERDGRLVVNGNAVDREILKTLVKEELILDENGALNTSAEVITQSEAEEITQSENITQSTQSEAEKITQSEAEENIPKISEEPELIKPIVTESDETGCLTISFPMTNHTGISLRNLVNLVYSKAALINKSLRTAFSVSEELAERLRDDSCAYTVLSFIRALSDYKTEYGKSGICGLEFTESKVTFSGFKSAEDSDYTQTCIQLCELMNRQAITQKRIQLRMNSDSNEKYAMRIWLVRIGMGGAKYKTARRVLLGNLEGNGAFHTQRDAERAKVRNKRRRKNEASE